VRAKLAYPFEECGVQTLKNIADPVRIYALGPEKIAGLASDSQSSIIPKKRWRWYVAATAVMATCFGELDQHELLIQLFRFEVWLEASFFQRIGPDSPIDSLPLCRMNIGPTPEQSPTRRLPVVHCSKPTYFVDDVFARSRHLYLSETCCGCVLKDGPHVPPLFAPKTQRCQQASRACAARRSKIWLRGNAGCAFRGAVIHVGKPTYVLSIFCQAAARFAKCDAFC